MSSITKSSVNPYRSVTVDGKNHASVELGLFALPRKWVLLLLCVPMLTALGVSGYLSYASMTASEIAGCTGGELFDCGHVVNSKWSKFLGIPVSLMAVATYAAMLIATAFTAIDGLSTKTRQWSWTAVTGLAIAAALAGLYFVYLQVFVLEHLCPWCLAAHTCGLIIAATAICYRRINTGRLFGVGLLAAAGLAVMIVAQINAEEPQKYVIERYDPIDMPTDETNATLTSFDGEGMEFMAPPVEEDSEDLFAPPSDSDDALFGPPTEDDSLFDPPSEDTEQDPTVFDPPTENEVSRNRIPAGLRFASIFAPRLALMHFPVQEQIGSQTKPQNGSQAKPQTGSQTKPQTGSQTKPQTGSQTKPQAGSQTKPQEAKQKQRRIVSFMGGRAKLDANQWPLDGDPNAKHVFVEMFDYTCPHCRSTTQALYAAKAKLGGDVAVIALPVPLNSLCNPLITQNHPSHVESCQLARLAVCVWRCDAQKFAEFHKWMFQGQISPNYSQALTKAAELVGSDQLNKELAKKIAGQYIERHVKLYKMVGGGAVPKLLFPQTSVVGEFTATDALVTVIQEQTGGK